MFKYTWYFKNTIFSALYNSLYGNLMDNSLTILTPLNKC